MRFRKPSSPGPGYLGLAALAGLLFLSGQALAHEWIIKASPVSPAKGDTVKAEFLATHFFDRSEETEPLEDVRAQLVQGGRAQELKVGINPDQAALDMLSEFRYPENGPAWLVGHRLAQPWSYTPDGPVPGRKADLAPEVAAKVTRTAATEKWTKLLLSPSPSDRSFSQPLGHRLEIVPLENPAQAKAGQSLKVQVLYEGQPIGLPILATYAGFSQQASTYAFYTETSDPEPRVQITEPGMWIIRASKSGEENGETYTAVAILQFEVK
jgi:uncharacterized GH25 family protein